MDNQKIAKNVVFELQYYKSRIERVNEAFKNGELTKEAVERDNHISNEIIEVLQNIINNQ